MGAPDCDYNPFHSLNCHNCHIDSFRLRVTFYIENSRKPLEQRNVNSRIEVIGGVSPRRAPTVSAPALPAPLYAPAILPVASQRAPQSGGISRYVCLDPMPDQTIE